MEENGPNNAGKKEKGRVRFDSMTAKSPPMIARAPQTTPAPEDDKTESPVQRPRPSIIRGSSYNSVLDMTDHDDGLSPDKLQSAVAAQKRAQELSQRNSFESDVQSNTDAALLSPGIPMDNLYWSEEDDKYVDQPPKQKRPHHDLEAYKLVRVHTQRPGFSTGVPFEKHDLTGTPDSSASHEYQDLGYDSPQDPTQEGVLSNLLKLYRFSDMTSKKDFSGYTTPGSSGTATPTRRKWYDQNASQDTLASLAAASAILANPNDKKRGGTASRPKHKRTHSGMLRSMIGGKPRMEEEARITIHVANILKRQEYIIKLCRALMLFGAPTHRLEEYLRMIAKVLEINGQFLYLPGCMIISFDDVLTHTAEVKIVRTIQGVNLGKLKDVHEIYKEVLHDVIPLEEATVRLDDIMKSKDWFDPWIRVLMYGFASATVAPFAFGGRPIDMPMCFILGSLLGFLQIIVAPWSDVYSNVFEIGAAVLTSFLARAFGSIRGGELFCFSAIAQSAIVLILPGYLVLCAALELQSRAIVPGSIRMVYAIIYSLFLGFGITIGTAIYGFIDKKATSSTSCTNTLSTHWNFLFVPFFSLCLTVVNQAKWKQMPVMIAIAMAGYVVNFFTSVKFPNSPQISNTLGAFSVGVLANLYSRLRHGVAAAALLPAIFVQVPSGLAATGSLLSGLTTANQLTSSTYSANGTINGTSTVAVTSDGSLDTIIFNVAASMIQIAVGITVGLFFATLLIYPLGKRRSGLFTF